MAVPKVSKEMDLRHIGIPVDKIHTPISDRIAVCHVWKALLLKILILLQVSHILPSVVYQNPFLCWLDLSELPKDVFDWDDLHSLTNIILPDSIIQLAGSKGNLAIFAWPITSPLPVVVLLTIISEMGRLGFELSIDLSLIECSFLQDILESNQTENLLNPNLAVLLLGHSSFKSFIQSSMESGLSWRATIIILWFSMLGIQPQNFIV